MGMCGGRIGEDSCPSFANMALLGLHKVHLGIHSRGIGAEAATRTIIEMVIRLLSISCAR